MVVMLVGCGQHAAYVCASDSQCVLAGVQGACEPDGHCAFPDSACAEGLRYEPNAGDGFGGQCVGEVDGGIGACGTMGNACCATGPACGNNTFCDGGTCKQCITEVALGVRHSCFLKYDGTVWCSGADDDGQLGNAATSTLPTATPVQVRDSTTAPITDATAIGAGQVNACAIRAGGAPWCWGLNDGCTDGGQLGDGTTNDSNAAVKVLREDGMPFTNVAEIAGDYCQTCARETGGALWCWGDRRSGSLGDGGAMSHAKAVPVRAAAGNMPVTNAAQLSLNGGHACYRTATNEVWCWGSNFAGQIGDGSKTDRPNPVHVFDGIALASGRNHVCAIKADNSVWCWGAGFQGRLGNGLGDRDAGSALDQPTPAPVVTAVGGAAFAGAMSVAAGASSCAILANKDLYCWGVNNYGQTGTGPGTYVPMPVLKADGTPLKNVARVVAQFNRTCAFTTDGGLYCFGRNSEGELGDGTFKNVGLATPVKLSCP
jgi:alpha-tubulin suppressor-like RCC1 family protein